MTRPTKVLFRFLEPEALADFASRTKSASASGLLLSGASLLADLSTIKRAEVPILRSLNIRFRLKQHAASQLLAIQSFEEQKQLKKPSVNTEYLIAWLETPADRI